MSNFSMRAAAAALPEVNVDPLNGLASSSTDDQKSPVTTLVLKFCVNQIDSFCYTILTHILIHSGK
jgi:hypothetical protein